MYGPVQDGDTLIPAVDPQYLTGEKFRQEVNYRKDEPPGTIVVDPHARYPYFVLEGDCSTRRRGQREPRLPSEGVNAYARPTKPRDGGRTTSTEWSCSLPSKLVIIGQSGRWSPAQ